MNLSQTISGLYWESLHQEDAVVLVNRRTGEKYNMQDNIDSHLPLH